MANRYVRSGAAGAGTGADWTNAFTTLALACAADAAGDIFWIADDHAESTAGNITPSFAGSTGTPSYLYNVSDAGSVPPVAADLVTTGTVTTTGGTSIITLNGSYYCYGLTFSSGTGATGGQIVFANGSADNQHYKNCNFAIGTSASTNMQIGATGTNNQAHFQDCGFTFGAVGQTISIFSPTFFSNCVFGASGSVPTLLITAQIHSTRIVLEGCDLSNLGSGKAIFGNTSTINRSQLVLKDCKLNAAGTIIAAPGSTFPIGVVLDIINCDSGDTNYRNEHWTREGKQSIETTIVRTGGASNGTTPFAWKIETSTEAEIPQPFECPPITIWNSVVGVSRTVTIEGIWGGGAVPDNNDIWLEAQYLGTSGFPIASRTTGGVATPLHTATNHAAGAGTWGGSTTKFKLTVAFTPQEVGPVTLYVKAGLASQTFYIDPDPMIA
jgi:hypothetical protein